MTKPYPSSTYRIQLHAGFNFLQLEGILDYLHDLGISTVYASPVLTAIKGSQHGYDAVDPRRLNEEIGTEAQWHRIREKLKGCGMSWLQDIVPNHMAFENANPWIYDLLERGPRSEYYSFFDIISPPGHTRSSLAELTGDKLMVPFLGKTLTECLRDKELKLDFSGQGFVIRYFEKEYPVAIPLYRWICTITPGCPAALLVSFAGLEKAAAQPSCDLWRPYRQNWIEEVSRNDISLGHIRRQLRIFEEQVSLTGELVLGQNYMLTHSRLAASRINYRRFFTINSLICLRMEDERVYSAYHDRILDWCKKGLIQGLRIDHIDGLAAPRRYIERLRQSVGQDCYIVAEKILEEGEDLPGNWPLQGTTGYEFLSAVGQVLTDPEGSGLLLNSYQELTDPIPYDKLVYEKKLDFLTRQMGGELENLLQLLESLPFLHTDSLSSQHAESSSHQHTESSPHQQAGGLDRRRLKDALAALMASFPIYRLYPDGSPWSPSDKEFIRQAFGLSRRLLPGHGREFNLLESLFEGFNGPSPTAADPTGLSGYTYPSEDANSSTATRAQKLQFLTRLMQFTGPLAAKGVEDTVFYLYNPYIGHNEVGDTPALAGITTEEFHQRMLRRQKLIPYSLNATTTHDTKRGEDARVRLYLLSAHPQEWIGRVSQWRKINEGQTGQAKGRRAPSPNDEYFIYQSILGSFPADMAATDNYRERFCAFLVKALREGKTQTNYDDPDLDYEEKCIQFAKALLAPDSPFLQDFLPYASSIFKESAVFSLSLTLIKMTAPGIPDIYQGAELWDLSLVDPDNRRPIDYSLRSTLLGQLKAEERKGREALFHFLATRQKDGAAKLWAIYKTLCYRKDHEELFADGEYIPVPVTGAFLAFMRRWREQWALIIVPLPRQVRKTERPMNLTLPPGSPANWENVLTNEMITIHPASGDGSADRDTFVIAGMEWSSALPIALLKAE
jgi:(1->4)-alpha-D-glucan 1-alpha-D-glucosylmutase